jgi:hypothetical protein
MRNSAAAFLLEVYPEAAIPYAAFSPRKAALLRPWWCIAIGEML